MVVNKWVLNIFPFPGLLMIFQFLTAAGAVRLLALYGMLECEPLVLDKVREFVLVPFVFGVAIFSNIKLLEATSVETAIVFRTVVPLFTSAADWVWMGRELPRAHSAAGLLIVLAGSVVYACTSPDGIRVNAWLWACTYVFVLSFEMVYVKHVLGAVPMSTWTRVYYNNALALAFMPPYLLINAEYAQLGDALVALRVTPYALFAVTLSCAIGLGISFTSFGFRNLVSAVRRTTHPPARTCTAARHHPKSHSTATRGMTCVPHVCARACPRVCCARRRRSPWSA
jgi:solute carrier family 35 protein